MYHLLHRLTRYLIDLCLLLSSGNRENRLLSQFWLLRSPTLVTGTANALLQESWNDILSVVKTKHTLTAWVHKLRTKNPTQRVPKALSTANASGASAPVVPPLQLPSRSPLLCQVLSLPVLSVCHRLVRGVCLSVPIGANITTLEALGRLGMANLTRSGTNMTHWTSAIGPRCPQTMGK